MKQDKLNDIEEIEEIIEYANGRQYAHHGMENYLMAIAKTQLLILKELRKSEV